MGRREANEAMSKLDAPYAPSSRGRVCRYSLTTNLCLAADKPIARELRSFRFQDATSSKATKAPGVRQ
jgi:hypothetical protein